METPSDVIGRPSPIQEICDWARAERLPLESPADTVGSCSSCPAYTLMRSPSVHRPTPGRLFPFPSQEIVLKMFVCITDQCEELKYVY